MTETQFDRVVPRPLLHGLGWGLAAVVVAGLLYLTWGTAVLLSVSFFIAYVLDPLVDYMERRGLPRTLTIALLVLAGGLGLFFFVLVLMPQVQSQASQLASRAPEWEQWLLQHIVPLLERVGLPLDKNSLTTYASQAWEALRSNVTGFGKPVLSVFSTMFAGIGNFIIGIVSIVFVPVFAFYLLRDFNRLGERFYAALPPAWRPVVSDWLAELDHVVGGFLRGQFTIAVILAALYAVGLSLLGVPIGVLLGVISGLANMVPYMSIVVGLVPALLLSLIEEAHLWRTLGVVLVYTGGQMLEGVYLGPRIMGKETGLHPVVVMVSIMVGGALFGLSGIILAVPTAGVLKVVLSRAHRAWRATWSPLEEQG
jgi:predicted PurR-regulated permease PerM